MKHLFVVIALLMQFISLSRAPLATPASQPEPLKLDPYGLPVSEDPTQILCEIMKTFPGVNKRIGALISADRLLAFDVIFSEAVDAGFPNVYLRTSLYFEFKGEKGSMKCWGHFLRDQRLKEWKCVGGRLGEQRFEVLGGHASAGRYTANLDLYEAISTDPAILKATGAVKKINVKNIQSIIEKSANEELRKSIYTVSVMGDKGRLNVEFIFVFKPGDPRSVINKEWRLMVDDK